MTLCHCIRHCKSPHIHVKLILGIFSYGIIIISSTKRYCKQHINRTNEKYREHPKLESNFANKNSHSYSVNPVLQQCRHCTMSVTISNAISCCHAAQESPAYYILISLQILTALVHPVVYSEFGVANFCFHLKHNRYPDVNVGTVHQQRQ